MTTRVRTEKLKYVIKKNTDDTKNATIRRSDTTNNNKTMSENDEKDTNEGTNDSMVRRKTYQQALCTGNNDT